MEALDHPGREEIAVEVPLEALLDAGSEHLDRDRLERAVGPAHFRLMHLSDRGGGDRRPELGVKRVDRRAQRLLDRGACLALREGRQAVLEGGEIARQLAADDVVAGGEELAELDVGRPERGERLGELRLVAVLSGPVLAERRRHAGEQGERRGQVGVLGQHARARPGDDGARLGQSCHVGDRVHARGLITVARRSGSRQSRR